MADGTEIIKANIIGGPTYVDPLLVRFSDTIRFTETDANFGDYSGSDPANPQVGTNPAYELFFNSASGDTLFYPGDKHPVYPGIYCDRVIIAPVTPQSPRDLQAVIEWSGPRINATNKKNATQTYYDSYQSQVVKNRDVNNALTRVNYIPSNAGTGGAGQVPVSVRLPGSGSALVSFSFCTRVADIHIPKITRGFRVVCYEDLGRQSVQAISSGTFTQTGDIPVPGLPFPYQPFYNTGGIWGFGPHEICFVGLRRTQETSSPVYRSEYNFLLNEERWDKFFAIYTQQDGWIPSDVDIDPKTGQPINPLLLTGSASSIKVNGLGAFDMLGHQDFNSIFANLDLPG